MQQIGRALSERYEDNRGESATLTRMHDLGMANVRRVLSALRRGGARAPDRVCERRQPADGPGPGAAPRIRGCA